MNGTVSLARRHAKISKTIAPLLNGEWQEIARIRTRWTIQTGQIAERSQFTKVLRYMQRRGMVESRNENPNDTEGSLWRRKERAK